MRPKIIVVPLIQEHGDSGVVIMRTKSVLVLLHHTHLSVMRLYQVRNFLGVIASFFDESERYFYPILC